LYALLPSVRALGALDRVPALNDLLGRSSSLPRDAYGTSLQKLYVEAADELRAHGDAPRARPYYSKALDMIKGEPNDRSPANADKERLELRAAAERGLERWSDLGATAAALMTIDSTEPDYRGLLGVTLAHRGRTAEAVSLRATIEDDSRPYLFGRAPVAAARIASALGNDDDAIADLARAFAEGRQFDLWLHRDSDFDRLRSLPAFQTLAALKRDR
jgi:hypothetical protein